MVIFDEQIVDLFNEHSEDVCLFVLEHPQHDDSDSMLSMVLDKNLIEDTLKKILKRHSTLADIGSILDLKKLNAFAISTMMTSVDKEVLILSARLVLTICCLPSASAYGLFNANVIHAFLTKVGKLFGSELKNDTGSGKASKEKSSSSSRPSRSHTLKENDEGDVSDNPFEDDEEEYAAETAGKKNQLSGRVKLPQLAELLHDLHQHVELFAGHKDEHILNTGADLVVSILYLCSLKSEYSGFSDLSQQVVVAYATIRRESLVEIYRSLMPVLSMAARNQLLPDIFKIKRICHKSALNAITEIIRRTTCVAPHDQHYCAHLLRNVEVDVGNDSSTVVITEENDDEGKEDDDNDNDTMKENDCHNSSSLVVVDKDDDNGDETACEEEEEDATSKKTKKGKGGINRKTSMLQPNSTVSILPFPHTCFIGLLQRITLSQPDRAPIRQLLQTSIVELLKSLITTATATQNSSHLYDGNHSHHISLLLQSIEHYLTFLLALSKSNKVMHRAFTLDIAAQILSDDDWIWDLPKCSSNSSDSSSSSSPAVLLLSVLLGRCDDCAPAVRTRSLVAIHELLQHLNNSSTTLMKQALLDAATGESTSICSSSDNSDTTTTTSTTVSLIDILRLRADDDKPAVRTKALQALGLALSMSWPKPFRSYRSRFSNIGLDSRRSSIDFNNSNSSAENVHLLVSEEDLAVFALRCRDMTSLLVRKQAIIALTELLTARPADALIQDVWLQCIPSMVFDPECSISKKVAEVMHEVLFGNLIVWYNHHRHHHRSSHSTRKQQHQRASTSTAATATEASPSMDTLESMSLVWRLSCKIGSMGLLKILKNIVNIMLKQGHIKGFVAKNNNGDYSASAMIDIITALKCACCFHLQQPQKHFDTNNNEDDDDAVDDYINNNDNLLSLHSLSARCCEPEDIAKAAWILLESLVAQDNVNLLNAKQENISFRSFIRTAGSTDFVIRCYRQRHCCSEQNGGIVATTDTPATNITTTWDEEDLRIFKVLEMLGGNLSTVDNNYMTSEIMTSLIQMQCECHIAAAAIAVLLQLTKSAMIPAFAPPPPKQQQQQQQLQSLKSTVQSWAAPLLQASMIVLHAYVFQSMPTEAALRAINANYVDNSHQHVMVFKQLNELVSLWLNRSSHRNNATSSSAQSVPSVQYHHHVGDDDSSELLDATMIRAVQCALFQLGEIIMLGFSMEEQDHRQPLNNRQQQEEEEEEEETVDGIQSKNQNYFRLSIHHQLVDLIKIIMGHTLPLVHNTTGNSSSGSAITAGIARECPSKLRAGAFVTMGKLCMRDKMLARTHVNIFLREVASSSSTTTSTGTHSRRNIGSSVARLSHGEAETSSSSSSASAAAAVRSNALLVLGDMCVRYTNLVDRHVDTMATCLQDSDALVRKNALILLTQLLLQDFLKWKGFLLYRFLVLTVDADTEIAEFARNILQRTLSIKYPQILSTHFTEAVVILNECTMHPVYSSIARTSTVSSSSSALGYNHTTTSSSSSDSQEDGVGDDDSAVSMVLEEEDYHNVTSSSSSFFLTSSALSKSQRFAIYAFMAEGLDDETKIQISAKLVHDILSAAVDNNGYYLHTAATATTTTRNNRTTSSSSTSFSTTAAFDSVLEDTFNVLRSPFLKVGSKKATTDDDDDVINNDNIGDEEDNTTSNNTSSTSQAANNKAAMVRAKSKVLEKLSNQHLISHTLPVVISLKHVLEANKSPLQGTLMEFLVALVKRNKLEVEQALQFDPTLKAELEYDLKQFEKAKKDKLTAAVVNAVRVYSARKSPYSNNNSNAINHSSSSSSSGIVRIIPQSAASTSTSMNVTTTTTTPYVNMKLIPTGSIVKPSLRKALLDHTDSNNNYNNINNIKNSSSSVASGRSRTPFDALKSPGMHLTDRAIRSVLVPVHNSSSSSSGGVGRAAAVTWDKKVSIHADNLEGGGIDENDDDDDDDVNRLTFSQGYNNNDENIVSSSSNVNSSNITSAFKNSSSKKRVSIDSSSSNSKQHFLNNNSSSSNMPTVVISQALFQDDVDDNNQLDNNEKHINSDSSPNRSCIETNIRGSATERDEEGEENIAELQNNHNPRRRSWSVVVDSLLQQQQQQPSSAAEQRQNSSTKKAAVVKRGNYSTSTANSTISSNDKIKKNTIRNETINAITQNTADLISNAINKITIKSSNNSNCPSSSSTGGSSVRFHIDSVIKNEKRSVGDIKTTSNDNNINPVVSNDDYFDDTNNKEDGKEVEEEGFTPVKKKRRSRAATIATTVAVASTSSAVTAMNDATKKNRNNNTSSNNGKNSSFIRCSTTQTNNNRKDYNSNEIISNSISRRVQQGGTSSKDSLLTTLGVLVNNTNHATTNVVPSERIKRSSKRSGTRPVDSLLSML